MTVGTRHRWLIVVASACGLVVGQGPIGVFAAGVFIKPLSDNLHLGRGTISTAIGVSSVVAALAAPFFGQALDAWGVRRPLLTSIALFALTTAAMGLLVPSLPIVFLLYALSGLLGVGQNPTAYSQVLAGYFDRTRGRAMGLALAGVGLGTALMPTLATRCIEAFGWRTSYVCLGIAILLFAFVPVFFWLPDPTRFSSGERASLPGSSFAEAIRSGRYWALAVAFFLTALTINGALVHVVPLLTDRGMLPAAAAAMVAGAGFALIGGRVAAGFVMDRVFAPYVAVASLVGPMAGLALLGWPVDSISPLVATSLLGLGIGAEVDLMSFLLTRYFGLRAFGSLHGLMFAALLLGNAAGASALGWSFQLLKSYQPALIVFEVLLVVTAGLFATLGPYKYPAGSVAKRAGEDLIGIG